MADKVKMVSVTAHLATIPTRIAAYDRFAYYVAQLLGWGLYSVLIYLISPGPKGADLAASALAWCGCGLFCTHVLRIYVNRHGRHSVAQLTAGFGVAIVLIPVAMVSAQALAQGFLSKEQVHSSGVVPHFFQAVLVISLWCALYFSAHEFRKRRAAEMEALRLALLAQVAQFRTLRSQLNPHFLFNSLNSLRELVDEDQERAKQLITRLSGLLRYTLRADSVETVPLKEELAAVEDYLALEKVRFEERLRLRYEVTPEALSARVPPMLLQTLAENGLKHGISKSPTGGELAIAAAVNDGFLRIEVTNTGTMAETSGSTAIGLENARERLKLVYGEQACLTLRVDTGERVRAAVTIPLLTPRAAGT